MPNPIPVIVLGRLAVDVKFEGQRLGSALLKDAMLRTLSVSLEVGTRALLVHAISNEAKGFYQSDGFNELPVDGMALMISVRHLKAVI